MRILIVEPNFDDNGAIRVSLDRSRLWQADGAEVTVLFVSDSDDGARVVIPPSLQTVVASSGRLSARWALPALLLRGMPLASRSDVIVAGREIGSGLLIGTMLARLARRPFAVTIQSNVEAALAHHGSPRHRRNVLACIRRADLVVPVSAGLVDSLVSIGVRAERIHVVPNGLHADRLSQLATESPAVRLPTEPFIVGLGRLTHQKGFDVLLRAHALALKNGAPAHRILLVGEGEERESLTQLAATLGVSDSVTFTGFLSNPYAVLERCSLFVLSSRWEGFSLGLAEALLLQAPCIATRCVSGPEEILDAGRYGLLVPVEDHEALAVAIGRHFTEPDVLRARAQAGSATVRARYDAAASAKRHLEALSRLL